MEEKKMKSITPVEVIVTYISIGWASVMFSDPTILSLSGSWGLLHDVGNRWVFGAIALMCALLKILGIMLDSLKLRYIGLILSGIFWTFLSVANIMGNNQIILTTGFIAYSGIAVLCLWTSKELGYGR